MVKESFGSSIATNVDAVKPDSLPVILIVYKSKGQIDVGDVIQGISSHISHQVHVYVIVYMYVH